MTDKPKDKEAFVNPRNVGGGSLMLAWQLKDKTVLIVGGGEVASQRIDSVIGTDAHMIILCPQKGLHPRTTRYIELFPDRITYHDRRFTGPAELHKVDLVLTAIDDNNQSRDIVELCRQAKIPVNAADIPDLCDFFFGAQIRDGPLQVMISTNGNGPRLSGLLKKKLQAGLSGYEGEAITKIGELRAQLKDRAPGVGGALGRRRMRWMTQLCDQWDMADFTTLDESMIKGLLDEGWEKDRIPTIEELGGRSLAKKGSSQGTGPGPASLVSNTIPWSLGLITGALLSLAYVKYARLT